LDIPSLLPPSLLSERLESLSDLYRRADAAVADFAIVSGVSCPSGCGTCCEGFVPDILPLEAAYIASYLAGAERQRAYRLAVDGLSARERDDGRTGCPLYNDDGPYHCTVYEARPLICRMFAFSAVRGKLGIPAFSVCRVGVSDRGCRSASGERLVEAFGAEPPVMADFGSELSAIDPTSAGDRKDLPTALVEAVGRVLFLIGLRDDDPQKGGPDMCPPLPRAG